MKYKTARAPVVQPIDPTIRHIALTKGQIAIVDAADYEWLNQSNWFAEWNPCTRSFYAKRNETVGHKKQVRIFMHREIMGVPYGDKRIVDHREPPATLDNRRSNLRIADKSKNMHNRRINVNNNSGCKGVFWIKHCKRWVAYINFGRTQTIIGYYVEYEDACAARTEAAHKIHGDFARM